MTDVRVMIVVGMHRTGTSALTRGLTALGVELGEDLLPPNGDNPKGFWENTAIVALDEHLLTSLGHSWSSHGFCAVAPSLLGQDNALFFEAVQLIRASTSRCPLWGFKDPRSARLLPFWQAICQHLALPTGYVIALRHPRSVACSLAARNGFAPQKSDLLWLEHYVCAFKYTQGYPVIVVDYDRLLEEPLRELDRVVIRFGLRPDGARDPAKEEYRSPFLERALRHTHFAFQDVSIDPCMGGHVGELYQWGYQLATDQITTDDERFHQFLAGVEGLFTAFLPTIRYVNGLEVDLHRSHTVQAAQQAQLAQIQQASTGLRAALAARDARILALEGALGVSGDLKLRLNGQVEIVG